MSDKPEARKELKLRRQAVIGLFLFFAAVLSWRTLDLQLNEREFLQGHGDARYLRVDKIETTRGMILDRNGEPLAISTPTQSAWVRPDQFVTARKQWPAVSRILGLEPKELESLVMPRLGRKFVYLQRHLTPDEGEALRALNIPGLSLQEEQRRFYPAAEVTAHIIGFTNVDDHGQEGIELAYEKMLRGEPGLRRVIKDRLGRVVEDVERLRPMRPGHDTYLSIDERVQYVAYKALKTAVQANRARAGMMVIVDPRTGEVIALVNQPSFNPNNRGDLKVEHYRNRAVTDLFEPGSTMKPFTIAAALESGQYQPDTVIETAPGRYKLGRHTIRDIKNFGTLDVAGVIEKSSNVGSSKIALSLEPEILWRTYRAFGFGSMSEVALPGEAYGRLNEYRNWREIEQATIAFGYGLSVTAMQLARAYTAIANDGWMHPLSILKLDEATPRTRVIQEKTAQELRRMLERVVVAGTARKAQVPGYSVGGKTGTVHKSTITGYAEHRYLSLFAGMIPLSRPRLVAVVIIDEPQGGEHYGGLVAAPIFSTVMQEATRILNIPPDMPAETDAPTTWFAQHEAGAAAQAAEAPAPEIAQ